MSSALTINDGSPVPDASTVPPLSLRRNFSWTLAANVVYSGCQWGMLIVLAKLGSPEMVGKFALGLAVTAPIILFLNLQLRAIQATDAKREYQFGHYLALRLVTTALALLIIAGLAMLPAYRGETAWVILAVGLAKCVQSISDVFFGLFQQRERMDRIAISMMIKGPISLAALCAAVAMTGSVAWGAAAMAGAWMARLFMYDIPMGRKTMVEAGSSGRLTPIWDVRGLWRLAWLALPLGVTVMLQSLNTNIPRYLIEHHWGNIELGIFAAIAYLTEAGRQVVDAIGQSASPRLAKYFARSDMSAFQKLIARLVFVAICLASIGILTAYLAGRPLLTILYRPEYGTRADVLLMLAVAAGFSYVSSFLGHSITAARSFRVQVVLNLVSVAVTAGIAAVLVPRFHLTGAAWTVAISTALQIPIKACTLLVLLVKATPSNGAFALRLAHVTSKDQATACGG